jgi:hypothetical protein
MSPAIRPLQGLTLWTGPKESYPGWSLSLGNERHVLRDSRSGDDLSKQIQRLMSFEVNSFGHMLGEGEHAAFGRPLPTIRTAKNMERSFAGLSGKAKDLTGPRASASLRR